jgi:hypothetical protein
MNKLTSEAKNTSLENSEILVSFNPETSITTISNKKRSTQTWEVDNSKFNPVYVQEECKRLLEEYGDDLSYLELICCFI